jgi:hypothetical protein
MIDVIGCGRVACAARGRSRGAEEDTVAVEVNLDALLDKAYEDASLSEVLAAPVSALAGVSEGDAELLKTAFNIKTVADLGRNRYFRGAQLLAQLAEDGAK